MKRWSHFLLFVALLASVNILGLPAKAENICKVTDPTGTPLNVRDEPNGRVINTLKNGREVYIHQISYDTKNRPWVKLGGYYNGEYRIWGWVLREFISCYDN
jgi:hypothetical protein